MIYTKRTVQTLIRYEVSMRRTTLHVDAYSISSGEVHDFHGVLVHSDGPGHGCWSSLSLGPTGDVGLGTLFSTVALLLYQVISASECDQVSVVGRGRDGDRSGTAHVGVAQLVGQLLQLVSLKPVVIPENVVVSWSGGSLDSLVRAEIEVELCRMGDPNIQTNSLPRSLG